MTTRSVLKQLRLLIAGAGILAVLAGAALPAVASAATSGGSASGGNAPGTGTTAPATQPKVVTKYQCGSGKYAVSTSINIGCYGAKCSGNCSALVDAAFAIIRVLSAGVGIVIIGSVVFAGVQYSMARDDPSAVGKAKSRITSSLIALLIFIFAYAILNYVIPAGFFT